MIKSHMFFKSIFKLSLLLFISAVLFSTARAAGEVDPAFNALAYNNIGMANVALAQPDGKILIGGNFTVVNGVAKTSIIRTNLDGTLDTTFNLSEPLNGSIAAIAFQSNGKILAGGNFSIAGTNYTDLIRLNSDGSLDTSFATPFSPSNDTTLFTDVFVRSDDTIYVNGRTTDNRGGGVIHLDSNGNVDPNFHLAPVVSSGVSAAMQPDGKLLVADAVIYRINTDGSVDSSLTPTAANGSILKIIVQSDGKILIGGRFTAYGGFGQPRISRLNSNGSIDVSFNPNGTGANGEISNIALAADGKITIGGLFTQYNGVARNGIARLNSDGTLDNSFNPALSGFLYLQPDGKVLVKNANEVRRLNADGTVDDAFNTIVFGSIGTVYAIVQQPDGKVIAGGTFTVANGITRKALARYNLDGSLDVSFVPTGISDAQGFQPTVYAIALQSDGKIVAGGWLINGLIRLNTDGSKDTSFVPPAPLNSFNYIVNDIDVLPDGRILVNGTYKLETNGSLSPGFTVPTFPSGAVATVAVVQPDGKFIIAGTFGQVNGVARGRIARLNADGTLDTTFNPPLGANGTVTEIDLQSDGKVVLIGSFTGLNGDSNRKFIGRLNSDGSLDTTFNPVFSNQPNTLKIQPDGKILIGSGVITINGVSRNGLTRLNSDGSLDTTFNVGSGANGNVYRFALQTDNKILIGGSFTQINNVPKINIARLLNNPLAGRTLFDFDGDGKADLSVFRPSNAFWYIARPTGIPSQNFDATLFGVSTDKLAPADYDGDGRTDIAVWRESSLAYFYILQSQSNNLRYEQFGQTGDVPLPGDWDGDGKADLAVYRDGAVTGGQSLFIYRPSSAPGVDFRIIYWGIPGDKSALGDFDGDGKQDAAVFRPSSGIWYIKRSSDDQLYAIQFGSSADNLVPADYDGDGRTDVAVFRPSNGVWYLQESTAGFIGVQFGQTGDKPAPADYDGDRKADLAVFRDGIWYLQRSTAGFTGVQFGGTGDQPVPYAFVR